jgi:hypothetical protein
MGSEGLFAASPQAAATRPPKARRVIQLFMAGAASHIDLFDYKPALVKRHGEPSDFGEQVEAFQNGLGPWKKPVWDFRPYGRSGKRISDAVAPLGDCIDDIAFVHNLVGKTGVHSQGTLLQATGFNLPGFPGMGSWVSYGLGSLSENLPAFVVLPDHRGFASNGPKNLGRCLPSFPTRRHGDLSQRGDSHLGSLPSQIRPLHHPACGCRGTITTREDEREARLAS